MTSTDTHKLVLIGGGGHCKSVIDAALSSQRLILGIIDADSSRCADIMGFPILGNDNAITELIARYGDEIRFVITIGQIKTASTRHRIAELIIAAGGKLASPIIASTAHVAHGAQVGDGSVVLHHALVNSDATVAENSIINSTAVIEHDCTVGSFTHISTGAIVNGMSHIGNDCFVGSHATIANCLNITSSVVIGAGATVVHDILSPGTYCGVPAHGLTNQ